MNKVVLMLVFSALLFADSYSIESKKSVWDYSISSNDYKSINSGNLSFFDPTKERTKVGVTIFTDKYYRGEYMEFLVGAYSGQGFPLINSMSSFKVGPNTRVSLYKNYECIGEPYKRYSNNTYKRYSNNNWDLDDMNNNVRCLKVSTISPILKNDVILEIFEHNDFEGEKLGLPYGTYSGKYYSLINIMSSYKLKRVNFVGINDGLTKLFENYIELYTNYNCIGAPFKVDGFNVRSIGYKLNDRVKCLKVKK